MIDVHCLVYKNTRYFPELLKQIGNERNVNLYIIRNNDNIGKGRLKGFLTGNSPYVSLIDYDDLIQPGIFIEIEALLDRGCDCVYTDEVLIDENGEVLQPGWSSNPERYSPEILEAFDVGGGRYLHHLVAFRRELLRPYMALTLLQLHELAEPYLWKELGRVSEFYHLRQVGYYWRQHKDNGFKKFFCYKFFTNLGGTLLQGE